MIPDCFDLGKNLSKTVQYMVYRSIYAILHADIIGIDVPPKYSRMRLFLFSGGSVGIDGCSNEEYSILNKIRKEIPKELSTRVLQLWGLRSYQYYKDLTLNFSFIIINDLHISYFL
jgi:hypothetical protein